MRTNLKILRVSLGLTQAEMAERIGCNRGTYANIENGKQNGGQTFWTLLQRAFDIPDCDMWQLMRKDLKNNAE